MSATPLAYFALPDAPWMTRDASTALCAQTDPDLWFADSGEWTKSRLARQLCRTCPLLAECRAWALAHPTETATGVWGGLTETERNAIRHGRGAGPAAPDSTREAA